MNAMAQTIIDDLEGLPIGMIQPHTHIEIAYRQDGRRENRMDPETKAVHLRLVAWGKWSIGDRTGTELPYVTLLGRVIKQGSDGAAQKGGGPVNMPEDVAVTDAAVSRLGTIDKTVIRQYYLFEADDESHWRRCKGIRSMTSFRNVLKRARWRVAGFIDGYGHRL